MIDGLTWVNLFALNFCTWLSSSDKRPFTPHCKTDIRWKVMDYIVTSFCDSIHTVACYFVITLSTQGSFMRTTSIVQCTVCTQSSVFIYYTTYFQEGGVLKFPEATVLPCLQINSTSIYYIHNSLNTSLKMLQFIILYFLVTTSILQSLRRGINESLTFWRLVFKWQ